MWNISKVFRKFMTHSWKKVGNYCKVKVDNPSYSFLETLLQKSWIKATHMPWPHHYINFDEPSSTLRMYCTTECKQQCHTSICHHHSTASPRQNSGNVARRQRRVLRHSMPYYIRRLTQWLSDWILHWQGLNLQLAFTALQLSHRKSIFRHDWNCHARSSHYSYLFLLI